MRITVGYLSSLEAAFIIRFKKKMAKRTEFQTKTKPNRNNNKPRLFGCCSKPGGLADAWNPSTQEVEAKGTMSLKLACDISSRFRASLDYSMKLRLKK